MDQAVTEDTRAGHRRPVMSFVRRGSRMTPAQRHWLAEYGDRFVLDVPRDATATVRPAPPLEVPAIFGRSAPLIAEIGCGHGETLAAAAKQCPDTDFIGFEVFDASVAATLGRIAAADLTNVRLITADAVSGLARLVPDHALAELWVFFPDPWPKARHHKRRLVGPAFADLAARKLTPGGRLRLATDWESYAVAMAAVLDAHPGFTPAGRERYGLRPVTKFEARGLAAGRVIHDLAYTAGSRP